ncbi:MAG: hypothetical protein JWQ59_1181 [Cryobacterium sp.]|nr:hypothetical protein [Cryobacterium sp.]
MLLGLHAVERSAAVIPEPVRANRRSASVQPTIWPRSPKDVGDDLGGTSLYLGGTSLYRAHGVASADSGLSAARASSRAGGLCSESCDLIAPVTVPVTAQASTSCVSRMYRMASALP